MATRIAMERMEFDREVIQDMLSKPATNRMHLKIAQRALHDAITNELTPRQREILLLCYFEQKKQVQIAEELGIYPSTVSRTLRRAEERLRRSLRFYFDYQNAVIED